MAHRVAHRIAHKVAHRAGAGENTPGAPGTFFVYPYVPTIDDVTSDPKSVQLFPRAGKSNLDGLQFSFHSVSKMAIFFQSACKFFLLFSAKVKTNVYSFLSFNWLNE